MISAGPILINGVAVPTPSSYTFDIEDLSSEETGRTLDGIMHKDVVDTKDYYTVTWNHLSWEQTALILNLVDGKEQITVTLIDPRYPNTYVTKSFYVGKRSGQINNLRHSTNTWTKVTLQFIRI